MRVRRIVVRIAWLLAAVVLSLGVAGIASGLDHLPSSGARPELTYGADAAIRPGLDAASDEMASLAADVDGLGELGRVALSALVARDLDALRTAIADGTNRITGIEAKAAALRERLRGLPGAGEGMAARLGPATIARYDAIVAGLPSVDNLGTDWTRLATGSVPAIELTTHLTEHDRIAGEAIREGAAGRYAAATTKLAGAVAELTAARTVRDALAATVDVSTLDQWIERNAAYDAAVRNLWSALEKSNGRVTAAVRKAAEAEQAAKAALPPDTRALVIILGDVARGGLNQAVIAIEDARGRLNAALAAAQAAGEPSASPAP